MMKNNFKDTIEFVGLSYKKEILKITLVNIAFLGGIAILYFVFDYLIYVIVAAIALMAIDYLLLSRYKDKKNLILKAREDELIAIISYFEIYLQNKNNVYQSFNLLIPFCSSWMKDKIETFLKEIDKDKTVQPFINFANNFKHLASHSLMLSIYQMVEQGESFEQLTQFNVIYDELAKNRNKELIEQKERSLANMSTFPLAGAGLITVTLTISILSLLGDLINVI
ncbi:MAG: hypothetical protein J6N95_05880 [Bacilli bacterium]|nr:hypothetical protein [Bacilli bacterium]